MGEGNNFKNNLNLERLFFIRLHTINKNVTYMTVHRWIFSKVSIYSPDIHIRVKEQTTVFYALQGFLE
jgi:hypothetical protein